jgi:asparagine synthase (glutamine-hydrolysing)
MLLGILDNTRETSQLKQDLQQAVARLSNDYVEALSKIWHRGALAMVWIPAQHRVMDESGQLFWSTDRQIALLFEGKIYNESELRCQLSPSIPQTKSWGEILIHLYEIYGTTFLKQVNGKFALALWDNRQKKLYLGRDHFGIQSLFYKHDQHRLVFGSSLRSLLATGWIPKHLNTQVLLEYLLYCYNPSQQTLVETVHKVPASHLLSFDGAEIELHRYWHLSFAVQHSKTEAQYCEEIPALVGNAVKIRLNADQQLGIFLSGGIDSSSVLSLASKSCTEPLPTFSFRCEGSSYDESEYARFVAKHFGACHTEVQYQPQDLTTITEIVKAMDEPFCDIGIEIGTYLLGRTAQNQVDYIFSGEGGDELFGGHPVYIANRVAALADQVPSLLLEPILKFLQTIPDSDQKKNLQVKLKRFAYSLSFPETLLSHRWRVYYKLQELEELCAPEFLATCHLNQLFDSMLQYTNEADGHNDLSRSLYSDYWTLVNFYLRRLELLKSFGIDNHLPLLDYQLAEYAAKIPSQYKIRGFSDTKYIYKQALIGIVPDSILFNRPKLGHSVPMKNWLRDDPTTQQWVVEILSSHRFKERKLFNEKFVQHLISEHICKAHNYSHRIWSLVVLELWLREHLD